MWGRIFCRRVLLHPGCTVKSSRIEQGSCSRVMIASLKKQCSTTTSFSDFRKVLQEKSLSSNTIAGHVDNAYVKNEIDKLQYLVQRRQSAYSFNSKQLASLTLLIQHETTDLSSWRKLIVDRPQLLLLNPHHLMVVKNFLTIDFGLSKKRIFRLLHVLPDELLQPLNEETFKNALSEWTAFCQRHDLDVITMSSELPSAILLDSNIFEDRLSELSVYFANQQEIDILLKNAPFVLMDHWPTLKAKMDLLIREMQVFPKTLAKSHVLGYDYKHIKSRYEFVLRAGLYRHPSIKSLGTKAEALPLIGDIVETDLETFVTKVVENGVTIEEFNVFVNVLDEEFDSEEERLWFVENGFEDPDFGQELEQVTLEGQGYTRQIGRNAVVKEESSQQQQK